MIRKRALTGVLIVVAVFGSSNRAGAVDPVTGYIAGYLGGHLLDAVWDAFTNKPNVRKLDERLKALEANAALRSEMREEIRRVRAGLHDRVTKDELQRILTGLQNELGNIKRRIDNLEERAELQEVKLDDLQGKTSHAENARHFLNRGLKFASQKEYYRALANFAVALRLDAKLTDAYVARARVYKERQAAEVAILDYSKAIDLEPKCFAALRERSRLFNDRKEYAKAIADTSLVLAEHATDPEALHQRGFAYLNVGDYDRAVTDYTTCLKHVARFATGWNNLGVAHLGKKDYQASHSCFHKAIELDGKVALYYANRARSSQNLRKYADAITDCDEALRLDANLLSAWEVRGLSRYENGQRESAIPDLTRAIALGTSNHLVYDYRGHWYYLQNENSRAVADLNHAERLGGRSWPIYRNRGEAHRKLKNYDDAIRDLTEVIRLNPEQKQTARAYWWRGHAQLQKGNRSEYRSDLTRALGLDDSYQKELVAGDVFVENNTNTPIVINIDYWVYPNGTKESFILSCNYKFAPGESAFLSYENKQIVAKKLQAYVETSKGRKLYIWDYKSGVRLDVKVKETDLP